jgi:hypothetical protein
MKSIRKVLTNQKGQGIMEYLIMTALIGIFCLTVVKQFGRVIQERIKDAKQKVSREINIR